nr:IS66 family transposase [Rhizobium terrae]
MQISQATSAERQERSAAIVANLFEIWEKELAKVSGKFKTAEAIHYAMSRRQSLERFLSDSRIEIDSNIVERAIRPQTKGTRRCLFSRLRRGISFDFHNADSRSRAVKALSLQIAIAAQIQLCSSSGLSKLPLQECDRPRRNPRRFWSSETDYECFRAPEQARQQAFGRKANR